MVFTHWLLVVALLGIGSVEASAKGQAQVEQKKLAAEEVTAGACGRRGSTASDKSSKSSVSDADYKKWISHHIEGLSATQRTEYDAYVKAHSSVKKQAHKLLDVYEKGHKLYGEFPGVLHGRRREGSADSCGSAGSRRSHASVAASGTVGSSSAPATGHESTGAATGTVARPLPLLPLSSSPVISASTTDNHGVVSLSAEGRVGAELPQTDASVAVGAPQSGEHARQLSTDNLEDRHIVSRTVPEIEAAEAAQKALLRAPLNKALESMPDSECKKEAVRKIDALNVHLIDYVAEGMKIIRDARVKEVKAQAAAQRARKAAQLHQTGDQQGEPSTAVPLAEQNGPQPEGMAVTPPAGPVAPSPIGQSVAAASHAPNFFNKSGVPVAVASIVAGAVSLTAAVKMIHTQWKTEQQTLRGPKVEFRAYLVKQLFGNVDPKDIKTYLKVAAVFFPVAGVTWAATRG